jgi:hypothetical protein
MTASPGDEFAIDVNALTFTTEAAELPPPLEGEAMVPRSFRLPVSLDTRLRQAAATAGVDRSELVRQLLEQGLATLEADSGQDILLSRAQILRMLASLPPASGAA